MVIVCDGHIIQLWHTLHWGTSPQHRGSERHDQRRSAVRTRAAM